MKDNRYNAIEVYKKLNEELMNCKEIVDIDKKMENNVKYCQK